MILNQQRISPLFVVGGLYTESSGVARIVTSLANAIERQGPSVGVYTAACHGDQVASHLLQNPSRCVAEPGQWLGRLSHSSSLRRRLDMDIPASDIVHNHSLWMLPNHYGSCLARRHGKPVIFTVHGTLEPWALHRSRWKKRLAALWFQDRDLHDASCIQVNSLSEARSVRRYGLNNPIAVIPNGVDLDVFDRLPSEQQPSWMNRILGKRVALFLSRLHAKKGVDRLVEAWSRVHRDHPEWHLVIAGPDDGLGEAVSRMVASMNLGESVTLAGRQHGRDKKACFDAADLFVLPSHSEGFSMAVLEAMASRLPVLLTPGCHFDEVVHAGAGKMISPDPDDIGKGLRQMFEMDDSQRSLMGCRGRAMVEADYTWDRVASQTLEVYRWMVSGGGVPDSVLRGRQVA